MLQYNRSRGQAVSVNTTGKEHYYYHEDYQPPEWKKSSAVAAFKLARNAQHKLHFKLYFIILILTLIFIAALIPWYYTFPGISVDTARTTGSSVVQGLHQLAVMITTFIALAIPLTANFYTPRLVDIFLKDRANICFLTTFGVLSASSVFVNSYLWSTSVPIIPYSIIVVASIFGWVMRFLDPSVIVDRVADLLVEEIKNTVKQRYPPAICRKRLNDCILQLGDIGFRSIDRRDSRTAISCIQAQCFALDIWREQKSKINSHFFHVEVSEFPMLSKSGLSWLSHSSLWVEEQMVRQLQKSFSAALNGMPSVISYISLSLKEQCLPLMNNHHHDRLNLELYIRFMNTFMREAINASNLKALFNLFYQYCSLVKDICKFCPDLLVRCVKYFTEYGRLCHDKGLDVAVQINYYDLGNLCGYVYRVNSEHADEVLNIFLNASKKTGTVMRLEKRGMVHSRIILGSFLLYLKELLGRSLEEPIEKIITSLTPFSKEMIDNATLSIMETTEEIFWEITDRIVNFDHVPPQQRPYVLKIKELVSAKKAEIAEPDDEYLVGSISGRW